MNSEPQMWRALAVYRGLALLYAVIRYLHDWRDYEHPMGAWAAVAVMVMWSAVTVLAYSRPAGRSWVVLTADLGLACALIVASRYLNEMTLIEQGAVTLPTLWSSAAVLAWAIKGGPVAGVAAAAMAGLANVLERGAVTTSNMHNIVILILAGTVIGYVCGLVRASERRISRALQVEAATRERERLARSIHDSVLQVLALVQRRGAEIGGAATELGRLAGEQEAALRVLVATGQDRDSRPDGAAGEQAGDLADLRPALRAVASKASKRVTVAAPGTAVLLPSSVVGELAAAVHAALDNVRVHVGPEAPAWVLVEDAPDAIMVTVRDDGPGIPPDRLTKASAQGRLGVAQSICGRLRDLGGAATVTSTPGQGTEVELRLPRAAAPSALPGARRPAGPSRRHSPLGPPPDAVE